MADPTLEEVAQGWAQWVAGGIIDELDEEDVLPPTFLDPVKAIIVKHLTDVAVSNAKRDPGPTTTDMKTRATPNGSEAK
jgi:hypothetical protein